MRRTGCPAVLLTAAAILLGVLGMHVLSGGPHTPRGGDRSMAPAMPELMAMVAAVDVTIDALGASLPPRPPELARPDLPVEPDVAMAAMCATLLFSLVIALGCSGVRRVRGDPPFRPVAAGVARRRELTRAPPPDLLTRLCVLRT